LVHRIAIGAHFGLLVAVVATIAAFDLALWLRLGLATTASLPLLATMRGLLTARGPALPWLALALVGYAGLGTVEVIAGLSIAAGLLLFLALLELGLLLILRRATRP
jgi:hypothetical protein